MNSEWLRWYDETARAAGLNDEEHAEGLEDRIRKLEKALHDICELSELGGKSRFREIHDCAADALDYD